MPVRRGVAALTCRQLARLAEFAFSRCVGRDDRSCRLGRDACAVFTACRHHPGHHQRHVPARQQDRRVDSRLPRPTRCMKGLDHGQD